MDLPIITAYSAVHSGQFGTVSSCAPTNPAPLASVVVGVDGTCIYHGLASFKIAPLDPSRTIQSATLTLYTPDQTGSTGVQVFANTFSQRALPTTQPHLTVPPAPDASSPLPTQASGTVLAVPSPTVVPVISMPAPPAEAAQAPSWETPSWTTAPAILTGATGIAQSGSTGNKQSWDVTSLVRQWAQAGVLNGSVTLVGTGTPVLFASSLGTGSHSPTLTPYLDITYAPPTAHTIGGRHLASSRLNRSLRWDPGVHSIWGIAGGHFLTDANGGCYEPNKSCSSQLPVRTVALADTNHLGGSYIRFPKIMSPCTGNISSPAYWQDVYNQTNTAFSDGVIPIVVLVRDANCAYGSNDWYYGPYTLFRNMTVPANSLVYIEIENEPNKSLGNPGFQSSYPGEFERAATGLYAANLDKGSPNNYKVLTGGLVSPVAQPGNTSCNPDNAQITTIQNAIRSAQGYTPLGRLSVAVHPYSYDTNEINSNPTIFWRNYKNSPFFASDGTTRFAGYAGVCQDLGTMLVLWMNNTPGLSGIPFIFTEENFYTDPRYSSDPNQPASDEIVRNSEARFLVDLVSWLNDHTASSGSPAFGSSSSLLRVMWYSGADGGFDNNVPPQPVYFGIYSGGTVTTSKLITAALDCPSNPVVISTPRPFNFVYYQLTRVSGCY